MRVCKQRATLRQTIKVGSLRLWVSLKTACPVVEVVDGDQQHIGAVRMTDREDGNSETDTAGKNQARHDVAIARGWDR